MALVLIEAQAWMPVDIAFGNSRVILISESVTIKKPDGTAATTYADSSYGSPSTADQVTDTRGMIAGRYIDDGEYDVTVRGVPRRVQAVAADPESGNTIYINPGLAAPGAAVQAAITRIAATGLDGQVVLRSGTHVWESVPALPPNLTTKLTVRGALGAKIQLAAGANRAFDFGKVADYDTFKNITLRDFTVDRNSIDAARHVICGTMPSATWTFRVSFDTIKIANITTVNVPTDSTGTNLNPNVWIYPGADTADTQCTVQNITVEDLDLGGGNFGVTVGGLWRTSTSLANVYVDNIKVRRIKHTITATPTSNYTSAHVFLVGRGFGGRVLVEDVKGINSGDVGIEVDAATKATIRSCEIREAFNTSYYHTNFQQPKDQYAQEVQWIDCHGHRETATLGRGWKTEQAASTVAIGTGNVTNTSASITSVAATTGTFQVGNSITGTGIPAGSTIIGISGSTITLNQNATATNTGVAISGSPFPGRQRVVDSTWNRNAPDWSQNGDAFSISDCPRYELRGVRMNVQGFNGTGSVSPNAVYLNAVSSSVRCRFVARNVQLRMNGTSSSASAFYLGMAMDRGNWTFDIDDWETELDVTSAAAAHTLGFQIGRTSALLNGVMSRIRFTMGSATGDTGSVPIAIGGTANLTMIRKLLIKDCSLKDMFNNTSPLVTFSATSNAANVIIEGTERKSTADEPIASITPGASPYSYQNLDGFRQDVSIAGGTVSAIDYSRDNATFFSEGATSGRFPVEPGDFLRVTYSVAPTMNKIPRR